MLLDDYLSLSTLSKVELDRYLSVGYYRMHQSIFTTDAICLEGVWLPVFWLRVVLDRMEPSSTSKRLEKLNSRFSVKVLPAVITDEINELYGKYIESVTFSGYETVGSCLNGDEQPPIFDTMMMEVRDGKKLIAAGYFDYGEEAGMGILNFYDPDYRKFSLGKLLMLKKLDYLKQLGIRYFYTGYFSTRNTKFDYKFFPTKECMQVYLRNSEVWVDCVSMSYPALENDLLGR